MAARLEVVIENGGDARREGDVLVAATFAVYPHEAVGANRRQIREVEGERLAGPQTVY